MEHERQRAELEKLYGAKFDIAYISGQITDHQKTVQLLEWEIGSGQDADLQHFASETLPTVLDHLQLARDIKAELGKPSDRRRHLGADQEVARRPAASSCFLRASLVASVSR